jgi:hypothetical protein
LCWTSLQACVPWEIIEHSPRNVLEMPTCSHKELKDSLGTWLHFHGSMDLCPRKKLRNITIFVE